MRRLLLAALIAATLLLGACGEVNQPVNADGTNEAPHLEFEAHEIGENVTVWTFQLPDGRLCATTPDAMDCDWPQSQSQ